MIQGPKVKWVAHVILCGALIAGSSVAIDAATWNDSEGDDSVDFSAAAKPSQQDVDSRKDQKPSSEELFSRTLSY